MTGERRWCGDCQTMQAVEDQFLEDTGDSRTTVTEYTVTVLACGHAMERVTREFPSPLQQAGPTRADILAAQTKMMEGW